MKCHAIHFMPYPVLEEGYRDKYGSAWVTYPNSNWDPEFGSQLYREYLDELVYAAEMGFDGVCVNEHHQTAYSLMPSPNIIATELAYRTETATIAILGNAIPLRNDPLRVAEEIAMLDNMSRGRIISGFIRGIGAEYHSHGINPADSKERFWEAHDLILKAWTEDGPFVWEGKYFNYRHANIWPRPYQRPHPEVWFPSTGSPDTVVAAAERGYTYVQVMTPIEETAKSFELYRTKAAEVGRPDPNKRLAWQAVVYVADTDEQAQEEFWPHMDMYFNELFRNPVYRLFPVNYMSESTLEMVLAARGKMALEKRTFDELVEHRTALVGSPETIIGMIEEVHDYLGFDHLVTLVHLGGLSAEKTKRSIERITTEVLPKVRNRRSALDR
jgi:alkanesulfonate monooxygenase SsuD/methylene tetrahydromethanopterin reductase-like flavin-dependent oxidoreductase (luciferase family)